MERRIAYEYIQETTDSACGVAEDCAQKEWGQQVCRVSLL